jgi:MarR family transcriptional regulator for hemolysin
MTGVSRPARPPIGLTLAQTAKTVSRAFGDSLAQAGGSLPVWLILLALKSRTYASQREIAAAVGIQGATLTHHLNLMEADGLLTRVRDPANRRVHMVELTKAGEALFHRLARAARAHDERLRAGLSDTDIHHLDDLLHRLARNVTAASAQPGRSATASEHGR